MTCMALSVTARSSFSLRCRGFDCQHPSVIDDLKMKDHVTSIAFGDGEVCGQKFLLVFAAACRDMSPVVEFSTKALGQKYYGEGTGWIPNSWHQSPSR